MSNDQIRTIIFKFEMAQYHVYLCDLDTYILLFIHVCEHTCICVHACVPCSVWLIKATLRSHGSSHSDGSGDQIQIIGLTWQGSAFSH